MRWFWSVMMVAFCSECKQPDRKKVLSYDTITIDLRQRPQIRVANDKVQPRQYEDAVNLNIMMRDIVAYARKHKAKSFYKKSLKIWNFGYQSEAELKYGKLFSSTVKYLIVRRKFYGTVVAMNVLKLEGSNFVSIVSQPVDNLTYLNSGVKDINGDGLKDYFVHWYPSSGCCRRDIYDVYLYQKSKEAFTDRYEFTNPTFSPLEKIIRGVDYGQLGDVALYKYKWNGLKLDTIEYIFPDTIGKKYYISKTREFSKSVKVLKAVPMEYQRIKSDDWFKGIY